MAGANSNGSTVPFALSRLNGRVDVRWRMVQVSNGCLNKVDSVRVTVVNQDDLMIPNVITPNDDDANDVFIVPEELRGSQLQIYNRWGEDIYFSSSYQNTWMGEGHSAGVYYYTLHGVCPTAIKGTIHLLKH